MKITVAFLLVLEAACGVRGQMNPIGSGLQRFLAGVFGARGGGRYGNPGAGYAQQGFPQQHGSPYQSSYGGYGAPMGGMRSRPVFGNGMLSSLAGGQRNGFGMRRRWRRQAYFPEDVLTRGFQMVRRLDGDKCVLRACCEAAAKPGEFGSDGQLAVQFILSLRHDGAAPWQPYLLSARVGQAHGSLQVCRRIFNGCYLNREQLGRTTRERLLKAISCLRRHC